MGVHHRRLKLYTSYIGTCMVIKFEFKYIIFQIKRIRRCRCSLETPLVALDISAAINTQQLYSDFRNTIMTHSYIAIAPLLGRGPRSHAHVYHANVNILLIRIRSYGLVLDTPDGVPLLSVWGPRNDYTLKR